MPPSKKSQQPQRPLKSAKAKRLTLNQKINEVERNALEFESPADLKAFNDLPISDYTKRGLKSASFTTMTDIQAQSIPVALKGKDVLEMLYRRRWGATDGLGALIISPTRELAVQIFQVLRSIGGYHAFSAGLVIGGKNLKDESDRLTRMNILVATPGRLLQHMDQTFGFAPDNLQMLVLDEADRILDMGFQRTLSALLTHLPKSRQTLLFSATQTRSVHDLARLSLKDPVPIGVDSADGPSTSATATDLPASSSLTTPQSLSQHYLLCPLPQKLSLLFSFIKSHLHSKIIVFLSSCKQVRFVFESFCRLHPGIPLIHLHGKQKQTARLTMYDKFTTSKHAVLFATDIAARGLDFPSVDWVLQLDAPEDAETYVHRVGRTARYESKGNALMFLCPSEEEGMLDALKKKGIVVNKIKARDSKTQDITNQLQNLAFQDPELKYLGQRAFVSYLKSIHLHKDKSIFKLSEYPVNEYAESLGLPGAPKIKFLTREMAAKEKQKKNADRNAEAAKNDALKESGSDSSDEEEEDDEEDVKQSTNTNKVRTKYDRMFERKNQDVLSAHYNKLIDSNPTEGADNEDDFITLKRADHELSDDEMKEVRLQNLSKNKMKLSNAKRKAIMNVPTREKIVFGEDGVGREAAVGEDGEAWVKGKGGMEGITEEGQRYAEAERSRMKEADVRDKLEAKEKKKEKKRKRKERERGTTHDDERGIAVLDAGDDEDDGYVSPEFDLPDESSDEETDHDRPAKRRKGTESSLRRPSEFATLDDEEELALKLLRKGR
ncbi:ATP-dependent RNA helicase dbp4 [Marasmius tenuissimus]|uniref:ATP-dependent RNA helicase n=1 Tax=Marasmius tenuissimus TaxID=585030 RepID=A0ABR3AF45_9AGAR